MPPSPDARIEQIIHRITAIEEYWTHLERTVRDLDEVLRSVQDRLDQLEKRVKRLSEEKKEEEDFASPDDHNSA